ncbi:MmgE/PrpD family protein [Alisedimentitalea sp. MJ-SS2]|uniref:MmgE/PrpD family protein n=1 Tax=Aliisedimentitalea sp. MJ-SS2 TaxID=3049795 RepID=UPI00290F4179|nr:MmgE/PrpD family protein [Alisedimentitalea sp. MJ-SS2]MDU8929682.1 MmgE/PrpD family protein [Alisedimentitalea sp. MJ-SS2]
MSFEPVADFILGAPTIPDTALDMGATLLLDTIGIAAAANVMPAGRIARDHVVNFHAAASKENAARLMFDGRSASIPGAAFAAATQIDNFDGHDGYNPTKGHIGCAVVPALFAFAEPRPDLSARDALVALVIAYEVSARAAITLHATVSDYHTSGAWNALGVAALAARLMDMSPDRLRHAMGIAEYHGPRSQMMREIANPSMLHDGSGMGALVGSMSALLARDGFTGAPAITAEGDEATPFWADLGQDWTVEKNYIKPYPICRWAHGALDALASILHDHAFSAHDVASIEVSTFAESAALAPGMPDSSERAQYSLPFPLAVLLLYGKIGPGHITGTGLSDPRVAEILPRISVREEPRHSVRFPSGRWSDVSVTLFNGDSFHSGDVNARGGPEAPMALGEVKEKFRTMTAALTQDRAEALWQMRERMMDPEMPFSALAGLVAPAI